MMLLLSLVPSAAAQNTSLPADLLFTDEKDLFGGSFIDTGYLPDPGDAISVRFYITPVGGIVTEMEAESELRWPTAFQHTLYGVPGEGFFGFDTLIEMQFEVKIDVAGIFQSTIPVLTEQFAINEVVRFDTLVLPGSPEYPLTVAVSDPNLVPPFSYDLNVVQGIAGLDFTVEIFPELTSTMGGNRIETRLLGSTGTQDTEEGTGTLQPPSQIIAAAPLESTYFADLTTLFTLNIVPSATLDTIIGDFTLVSLDYPIELLNLAEERAIVSTAYEHPLPAMVPFDANEFQAVEVGNLANLLIPLENAGQLGLEGVARIEGSDVFTVWPEYFYADEDATDGVVVTFAPEAVGDAEATLILESNDPNQPVLRIPLNGTGFIDSPTPLPTPEPMVEEEAPRLAAEDAKGGCGCDASPAPAGGALFALLGLVQLRRRRNFTR